MTCRRSCFAATLVCALSAFLLSAVPRWAAAQVVTVSEVLEAEANRAAAPGQLDLLRGASVHGSPKVQQVAVRALGRLERPELTADLLPLLSATAASVRAEAANAVAQAVGQDTAMAGKARSGLLDRLKVEKVADARAAVCEALGRLPVWSRDEAQVVEHALTAEAGRSAQGEAVTFGALRGLESLIRLRGKLFSPDSDTLAVLGRLATSSGGDAALRRFALLALNAASGADGATLDRAATDPDAGVRRLAAASSQASVGTLRRALGDASPVVRYEALRAYGRRFRADQGCAPIVTASTDANPHVALLALDLLASPCTPGDLAEQRLFETAAEPLEGPGPLERAPSTRKVAASRRVPVAWYRQAHAFVSLSAVAPERAKPLLGRFLSCELWPVRMYAARAAALLGDAATLAELAGEKNANVREAAIAGLAGLQKHDADPHYLRALDADDNQLVMTAAQSLAGTPAREAAARAIVSALQRWTARDTDNSRDPRLALLDRLQEIGSRDSAAALAPLLRDADPRVAERAAAVITALTGQPAVASPARRSPQDVPSASELARLSRSLVRVTMANGRSFDVRLLPELAPLSCTRFARLVASGYYNGLTFHRVVSNFLIQGGSPGANEYVGHRRFMRDETGRVTQARGTLGTSTRGRDTGDAQIYINVVDNPRLDHDYTIFGRVVRGMDVVDDVMEADTIARAVLVRRGR